MRLGSTLAVSAPSYQVAGAGRALFAGSMTEDDMSLVGTGRATMLTALAGQITHVSLHTADPGDSGTSEVSGGSYARVAASWGTATATSVTLASTAWTIPAGTPTHVGFWTALSGGTFIGSARLANPSARSAGSFTVPSTVIYLDAGDILVSQGALDDFRLVLHNAGLLQAPLRLDSDCVLVVDPTGFYDAEQRAVLNSSLVTSRTALAVGLGNAGCAGPIFHTDKYGSVMWIDQKLATSGVNCTVPALTTAGTWAIVGHQAVETGSTTRLFFVEGVTGSPRGYIGSGGKIEYYEGATTVTSASTVASLLSIDPEVVPFYWAYVPSGTSLDILVSTDGSSWVNAVTGATVVSRDISGGTLWAGSNNTTSGGRGKLYSLTVRDGDETALKAAEFLPSMFAAGNRADGDTAVDAYGVTWTLERPAATTDMPTVNTSGGVTYLTSDGVNDFAQVCGDDTITDFVPATGLTLVLDASFSSGAGSGGVFASSANATTDDGLIVSRNSTNPRVQGRLDDGTTIATIGDNANNVTYSDRFQATFAFGSSDHEAFVDGVSVEAATNAVTAETAAGALRFGAEINGSNPAAFDLYGAAVVKRRLTDTSPPSEVQTIHTEGISA